MLYVYKHIAQNAKKQTNLGLATTTIASLMLYPSDIRIGSAQLTANPWAHVAQQLLFANAIATFLDTGTSRTINSPLMEQLKYQKCVIHSAFHSKIK